MTEEKALSLLQECGVSEEKMNAIIAKLKAAKDAEAYVDVFYATGAVKDALIENVNKAIRGEVDPKTALKTAQDQMNEKLKAFQH